MKRKSTTRKAPPAQFPGRRRLLLALFVVAAGLLVWRAVHLQVLSREFLQAQGKARYMRLVEIPAHRGMITDRRGEPLAISTPVASVWADPAEAVHHRRDLVRLARVLELDPDRLQQRLAARQGREFVYLRRHVPPAVAARVRALGIPGISLVREYRRYYPAAEVVAQVLGFTDIDDHGQEGLELAYESWLRGAPGRRRVIKDRLSRVVEQGEIVEPMRPGRDLVLSIDRRLQYLAYRELSAAMERHGARAASLVVLDATTGEVLAMASRPSFNPNDRSQRRPGAARNRAVTDVFEPGSTLKPFTITAALLSGRYRVDSRIDTHPGRLRVGHDLVRDLRDYGVIDLTGVITHSSNVGASKIALSLEPRELWSVCRKVGLGQLPGTGFPGEVGGLLGDFHRWRPIEQATLAYGYGVSVSLLQLAQAYAVLAADGIRRPVSFLRVDQPPAGQRVLPAGIVRQVRAMLETVVAPGGTGRRAAVPGYRVAGKTGTVHKPVAGGYAADRYVSLFAGMAPARNPRLVVAVMVDEPTRNGHFGGQVAAPVFSRVMAAGLRLLDVPPGDGEAPRALMAADGRPAAGGRT